MHQDVTPSAEDQERAAQAARQARREARLKEQLEIRSKPNHRVVNGVAEAMPDAEWQALQAEWEENDPSTPHGQAKRKDEATAAAVAYIQSTDPASAAFRALASATLDQINALRKGSGKKELSTQEFSQAIIRAL